MRPNLCYLYKVLGKKYLEFMHFNTCPDVWECSPCKSRDACTMITIKLREPIWITNSTVNFSRLLLPMGEHCEFYDHAWIFCMSLCLSQIFIISLWLLEFVTLDFSLLLLCVNRFLSELFYQLISCDLFVVLYYAVLYHSSSTHS